MKKIIVFVLVLCLCFAVFSGSAFAETATTEASAAEAPAIEVLKAEVIAEELFKAGEDAYNAEDYGKAMECFSLAGDLGNDWGW